MSNVRYPLVALHARTDGLTLESLSERARVHPHRIRDYVEAGLLDPCERSGEEMEFSIDIVVRLRCIERLRRDLGLNLAGLEVVLNLLDRMHQLHRELSRIQLNDEHSH